MDREKLNGERYLRIYFIDNSEQILDVNSDWKEILDQKERIVMIESSEWTWNVLTGEIIIH